jgi:hypothetical protein
MAKKKFTELPAATTPLAGTEIIAIVQGGVSKQTTVDDLPAGGGGSQNLDDVLTEGADLTTDDFIVEVGAGRNFTIKAGDIQIFFNESDSSIRIQDNRLSPEGVIYQADYSATLQDTSLVPKRYIVGVQDLFVSASAMWPRTTNPCSDLTKTEIATSLFNIQSLDFDQTTQEFAQFQIALPRKWNNGTVTAVFYWTAAAGSGDVQWGISGGAYSNDDALAVAFGTAQTVDDTLIAANDLHITSATSAITLAGTPASADFLAFQISRNPGSDTLTADAKLLGVSIRINTNSAIDG